ncbi:MULTISPECIES: hypothetical protein [Streptomycetaceae]|nr:hypothetical protein [Streptomyces sp. CB02056]
MSTSPEFRDVDLVRHSYDRDQVDARIADLLRGRGNRGGNA